MKLTSKAEKWLLENKNKKIVFTNGCFDLLHPGHVQYLNDAKNLGDALFIGLNSDESVSGLKGPTRPINNQQDRIDMLLGLKAVDFVEVFNEETPLDLIKAINPAVLVKGGDWDVKDIVGSEFVLSKNGDVRSLAFKPGYSSTNLIKKIKQS